MWNKHQVLKEYFGYSAFRPGQETLIDAAVAGRDVLGIMPTGGGKSLCYQIPALLLPGLTVVVSPLISLMQDQVMALKSAGVPAAYINSTLSYEQLLKVYDRLQAGAYKLLYIAPERLESDGFGELSRRLPISMVAVDEAHCVSQWGNDFRPSYLKIVNFIAAQPRRPTVVAFTATATAQVREDIEAKLGLRDPVRVTTGFDRPNLNFEVLRPRRRSETLLELVRRRGEKSGIIYCMTRSKVESVCQLLQENGLPATRYHAGLSDGERHRNQEDFVYDRKPIMVATNAFGMGIDKSNVSFVIHYNMPMSLEAYYQEAGRAGRDGEPADCILLYSPADIHTAKALIQHTGEGEAVSEEARTQLRRLELDRLNRMIAYCTTIGCLRADILRYFGEESASSCGNCSNCRTEFVPKDITTEAQKILSCVKRIEDRVGYSVGSALVVRVLHGSGEKRIRSLGLDMLSTYGIMKDMDRRSITALMDYLCESGYLQRESLYGTVTWRDHAYAVLFDGEPVLMPVPVAREETKKRDKKKKKAPAATRPEDLFARLRRLRATVAAEQGVPVYIVFSNATLSDMSLKCPTTLSAFMDVSGVGAKKAERYGARFLSEIRDYLAGVQSGS